MKKIGILLAFLCLATGSFAQDFEKGGNYICLGYGFDPYYKPLGHYGVGPIILNYEHGVTDVLGIGRIGAGGGFAATFYPGTYYNGIRYTGYRFSITARATYHFEFDIPKLDVYAGIGGALHIDREPYTSVFLVNSYRNSVRGSHYVFAGVRYFFVPAFGVFVEAGHGHRAAAGGMVFAF